MHAGEFEREWLLMFVRPVHQLLLLPLIPVRKWQKCVWYSGGQWVRRAGRVTIYGSQFYCLTVSLLLSLAVCGAADVTMPNSAK